jgi:nicotinamidase-related amidase
MKKVGYTEVVLSGLDECGCVGATAKGAVHTGIKVCMLSECIGSRFPDKKIEEMRSNIKSLGVEYI